MAKIPGKQHGGWQAGKAAVTASLCVALTAGPLFAAVPSSSEDPSTKPTPAGAALRLTDDQKALHALNRLTFGPRPGDLQAAEKIGLQAWFERQLNPQTIDDSAMNAVMAKFPAMQLTQAQLLERFPQPSTLRQMARQGTPLPSDPTEHAIYADAMANYNKQLDAAGVVPNAPLRGQKQVATASATPPNATMGDPDNDGTTAPAEPAAVAGKGKREAKRAGRVPYSGEPVEAILALPPDQRIAAIVGMSPVQAEAFRRELGGARLRALYVGFSPEQVETVAAMQSPIRVVGAEALESRLMRDVYSDRQLEAVMTDFWLNHFSVYARKSQNEPYLLPAYERDTIRPHALGRFEDLLVATAESPAMMVYLDNWQSIGPDSPAAQRGKRIQQFADANPNRPGLQQVAQISPKGINENYARELIELHTLGVRCEVSADRAASTLDPSCGTGYTQADVTSVAKVLTGWTIERPYGGHAGDNASDAFVFQENRHEGGPKQVLGKTIEPGGQREGLQVLHLLATSPATAQFISQKLAVRFVADNPPQAIVDRMAKSFLATGGDIKAVLRTMFNSPEFWSPPVYRAKVKTPIEFLASALRASDASVDNALPLVQAMDKLGMPVYGMQTPNGYSWTKEEWVSTNALISRLNFALVMSGDLLPGTRTDWPQLLGETKADPAAVPSAQTEKKLELLILGQPAAANTRAAVIDQSSKPGQIQEARKNLALTSDDDGADDRLMSGPKKGNPAKKAGGKGNYGGGLSMTDLAGATANDGPLATMAGLLLGSPEFQKR